MSIFKKIRSLFSLQTKEEDEFIAFLKKRLPFTPKNISLYKQAFQHKSKHSKENYERLEFLGDSILDAVVCELIYFKFPEENEGELSKLKSKLVSRETLNGLAEKLELERMYSYSDKLSISHFKNLGGNILEALIGAIYIDKGYVETRKFIRAKLINTYINWDEMHQVKNFKSVLFAKSQKEKFNIEFEVLHENPNSLEERFEMALLIDGAQKQTAKGPNKKITEQKIAEKYLNDLL